MTASLVPVPAMRKPGNLAAAGPSPWDSLRCGSCSRGILSVRISCFRRATTAAGVEAMSSRHRRNGRMCRTGCCSWWVVEIEVVLCGMLVRDRRSTSVLGREGRGRRVGRYASRGFGSVVGRPGRRHMGVRCCACRDLAARCMASGLARLERWIRGRMSWGSCLGVVLPVLGVLDASSPCPGSRPRFSSFELCPSSALLVDCPR